MPRAIRAASVSLTPSCAASRGRAGMIALCTSRRVRDQCLRPPDSGLRRAALLGHASLDTVMIYAKLYPDSLVEGYRTAMRGPLHRRSTTPTRSATPPQGMGGVRRRLQPARHGHPHLRPADRRTLHPRPGLPRLPPRPTQEDRRTRVPPHDHQPHPRFDLNRPGSAGGCRVTQLPRLGRWSDGSAARS